MKGFGSLTYFFYVISPKLFPNSAFCCGDNGTELGHIAVSCGVGLVGGLLTLFVMKIGLFAIGACLGFLLGPSNHHAVVDLQIYRMCVPGALAESPRAHTHEGRCFSVSMSIYADKTLSRH